ncbi:MAG: tRNA glutamyl-Q(34) synthetase GluQRS [Burkholderiales bacterium]
MGSNTLSALQAQRYCGRFAPSPTGPLHFGSLVAAVGSFLQARSRGGEWLVRMEDLDPAREVPRAADSILGTLQAYGMQWDRLLLYQSARGATYRTALERLQALGMVYACACSRAEIADSALGAGAARVYPGTCRNGLPAGRTSWALRVQTTGWVIEFEDALQGRITQDLASEVGDYVVRRADGLHAYQLAVVVDDAEQGVTEVVRGADLLGSTPRQIQLQRLLGLSTPSYMHLPVALDEHGNKLSKQTLAAPVERFAQAETLVRVLTFLNQNPPAGLEKESLHNVWDWAIAHWALDNLRGITAKRF